MHTIGSNILALDIGSVSLGAVVMTPQGRIVDRVYTAHGGNIPACLEKTLSNLDLTRVAWTTATAATPQNLAATARYDDQVCVIAAAKHLVPDAGAVLIVGGEKFRLIRLDKTGSYRGTSASTACAAGTGAFLDQQARRLNLKDAASLCRLAQENRESRPKVASRCAVFAKTDLIHAQQEGYAPQAICDGLCHGLAKNIVDTVFGGDPVHGPVIFGGGVARNGVVRRHIEIMTDQPLTVPPQAEILGALGAGLNFIREQLRGDDEPPRMRSALIVDLWRPGQRSQTHTYPPLTLALSRYPDFTSRECYRYPVGNHQEVEVDRYEEFDSAPAVILGLDIGSTSTKAVLLSTEGKVLAGFYTRTAGRPVEAMQQILESVAHLADRHKAHLKIMGVATTGSGRKFVGQIMGADLILDEISAHARAACQLDPQVDTIIEIGGQDAKFTTLEAGRVTSATMNTVCAAGTGSFIEEQAAKLGCALEDYSRRTENQRAPLTSDRCTVFMERDLNHYLSQGWEVDQILAAVLHAVRENYLLKVANLSRIGERIFFQGATAKNRALVAAFEQRLKKPIAVSKFCHLTGAMGCALTLWEDRRAAKEQTARSGFRGIDLWRASIPVRSEVCELCTNHCKLSVAEVGGTAQAYGFLCGRDYTTRRFVKNQNHAFDLSRQYKKAHGFTPRARSGARPVIGLPAGLHLVENLTLWRFFFDRLGFTTVTSEGFGEAIQTGKGFTGAEFCAPITALHGHVNHLASRCDYIFMPVYLEDRNADHGQRRQYCYYTQFAPVLVQTACPKGQEQLLTPLVRYLYTGFHTRRELYRTLRRLPGKPVGFLEVSGAFDAAMRHLEDCRRRLKRAWQDHGRSSGHDVRVVLLGRPYTVFSPALNSQIPELFRRQGIDCAFQDMLDIDPQHAKPIGPLLQEIHWRYAARILEAAQTIAATPGLYPVLVTSFQCSPDAFVQDYLKKLFTANGKPFLVLELDEHDSSIGYETRIEAAIRAFRNHHQSAKQVSMPAPDLSALNPQIRKTVSKKSVILPNWDRLTGRLLEATLRREGFNAILMQETPATIQKSLVENNGQCIPINTIVEGFVECMQKHALKPTETVLWLARASIACNIPLYPHHMKSLLNARGNGLEKADVFAGDLFFKNFSLRAAFHAVFAYMFGGMLRRVACKLRPRASDPAEVDQVLDVSVEILAEAFLGRMTKGEALTSVMERFGRIGLKRAVAQRPKVAIFGDLYSRDNRVINQDLVRFIEKHGGEVVTTPYSEYARMIASPYFRKWFNEGRYLTLISNRTLMASITRMERNYYRYFEPLLGEPMALFDDPPEKILDRFGVRLEHTGESLDNLIKVHYIKKHHPDIALFVQASPAFCCPSLVTEAMAQRIEAVTQVPVVSITYDGIGGAKNDALIPYLTFPRPTVKSDREALERAV